jgi:hypothetical protein
MTVVVPTMTNATVTRNIQNFIIEEFIKTVRPLLKRVAMK